MENTLKKRLNNTFLLKLRLLNLDLSEPKLNALAGDLASASMAHLIENNSLLIEQQSELATKYEQHRNMFKKHIQVIQVQTNKLMDKMKQNGHIKLQQDPNSKKTVMVATTEMARDLAGFLNILSDTVTNFYTEVYEIKENNNENTQTNIF